jgi:hypothetical protein
VGALAALGSLLLHALLITSLLSGGTARHARPPNAQDAGARGSADVFPMEVIFIDPLSAAHGSGNGAPPMPAFEAPSLESPASPDLVAEVSPNYPDESDADHMNPEETASVDTGRSLLFGRYVGQISARVERAWLRPRIGVDAPAFSCRVRIDQDQTGAITEVTLEQCNGNSRWQTSLVRAIQSASPLPAPPDPSVFSRVLRLRFQADPYSVGKPPDQYEPAVPNTEIVSARHNSDDGASLRPFGNTRRGADISLTIVGPANQSRDAPPSQ